MIKEAYMAGFASALEKLANDPTFEATPSAQPKPMTSAAENLSKSTQVSFNRSMPGNQGSISSFNTSPGKTGIGAKFKGPPKMRKFK